MSKLYLEATTDAIRLTRTARANRYIEVKLSFGSEKQHKRFKIQFLLEHDQQNISLRVLDSCDNVVYMVKDSMPKE